MTIDLGSLEKRIAVPQGLYGTCELNVAWEHANLQAFRGMKKTMKRMAIEMLGPNKILRMEIRPVDQGAHYRYQIWFQRI